MGYLKVPIEKTLCVLASDILAIHCQQIDRVSHKANGILPQFYMHKASSDITLQEIDAWSGYTDVEQRRLGLRPTKSS